MAYGNTAKDGTGDFWHQLQDANGVLYMRPFGYPELQVDEAANDSDKTITVPAGEEWVVKWIWVELVSDGNAGNRNMEIQIQDDAADVIARIATGIVQAANLTRYYLFAPNVTELAAFRDTDKLSTIMPEWVLPTGYIIRVWDNKAISAAGDDMVVQAQVWVREIS